MPAPTRIADKFSQLELLRRVRVLSRAQFGRPIWAVLGKQNLHDFKIGHYKATLIKICDSQIKTNIFNVDL